MWIARSVRDTGERPFAVEQRASPTTTRRLACSDASCAFSVPLSFYTLSNIKSSLYSITVAQKLSCHALRAARNLCAGGACSMHTSTRTYSDERPLDAAVHRTRCIGSAASCCSSSWQRWQRLLCDLACTSACGWSAGFCSRPSLSTYAVGLTATTGDQSMSLDASRVRVMCRPAEKAGRPRGSRLN